MRTGMNRKALLPERGAAWILTFFLTVLLSVTLLSTIAVQAFSSSGLHLRVATDNGLMDGEIHHIYEQIDRMAEEYGFSAEAVKSSVSQEELKNKNSEAAAWWTRLLTEGEMSAFPKWDASSIEEAVYSTIDAEKSPEEPRAIVADIVSVIERAVFPMRESLLTTGMKYVETSVDLAGSVRSLQKVPLFALMLSLLVAGLIALLLGREFIRCLKHFGTAVAGTGMVLAAVCVTTLVLQPSKMFAQASERVAETIRFLLGRIGTEAGLMIIILLAVGYLCLIIYRKKAAAA